MKMDHSADTKTRLLQAARKVFAQHGPQNATVRDICTLARANVAAVNYHFGSKEKLYLAVLEDHIRTGRQRYPLDAGVTPESPPAARLHAYIRSFFQQILGDGEEEYTRMGKLVLLEMIDPSEHFNTLLDKHLHPQHMVLQNIVREMLPGMSDEQVSRCAGSIAGQCKVFEFAQEAIARTCPEWGLKTSTLDRVANFITEFSLGGIERLKQLYSPSPTA